MAEGQLDLLQTLFQEWVDEKTTEAAAKDPAADPTTGLANKLDAACEFVNWARNRLQNNLPVSMDCVGPGFSLRFQDSTVIPFVLADEPAGMGGIPGGVPVTRPTPSKFPKPDVSPSRSWGITKE